VNRIVPSDQLAGEALELARQIARNPMGDVKLTKRSLQRNQEIGGYSTALELENRGQALLMYGRAEQVRRA
jgi:enoyl-CoA hydratase/carnithine racemase